MVSTLKPLLSSIVDYAGLFPPAQLGLPEAIATYEQAQTSAYHWLVGRFVLPASCLPQFMTLLPADLKPETWSLSVILSQNWAADLDQIRQLQAASHSILVGAVEVAPLPPSDIQAACLQLPENVTAFFEIPWSADLEDYLPPLQQAGAAAKLRTGGVNRDAFPDSAQLAQRILALAQAKVPFKATAGLHHPLRSKHPVTYEPDSVSVTMHGFLNAALLSAFAFQQGLSFDEAIALLEEQSIHPFTFTETTIHWRDHTLSHAELELFRQQFFNAFGSCSVQEPLDDLLTLNLL